MPDIDLDHPARTAREAAGLSQSEVGERLGISRAGVAMSEGRGDGIALSVLRRLCDALGLELTISVRPRRGRPRETQGRKGRSLPSESRTRQNASTGPASKGGKAAT